MSTIVVSSDETVTVTVGSPVAITVSAGTINAALTALGYSPTFQLQVQVAMAIVAVAILTPNAEDPTVPNFCARQRYSKTVLNNMNNMSLNVAYAVASDGVTGPVPGTSTDQELVDRMLAIWNQESATTYPY